MEPISTYLLFGIGFFLLMVEIVSPTFFFIFFSMSFFSLGIISLVYQFDSFLWQLITISFVSILSMIIFRNNLVKKLLTPEEMVNQNFLNETGTGIIKDGKVFYKSIYWTLNNETGDTFEEGEEITVLSATKGIATIVKKIEKENNGKI